MIDVLDLAPAARQVKSLLANVSDDQLGAPTPCEEVSVGDLLDHLLGLTVAFRDAATKSIDLPPPGGDRTQGPGRPSANNLPDDWRDLLSRRLDDLVAAWRDPEAWQGMTAAGGLALPGHVAGLVALDELVLHGWDLARGVGQPFECDPASTEACFRFTSAASEPGREAEREGLFGPVVEVPDGAPLFDRALGLSGRDPSWRPPG